MVGVAAQRDVGGEVDPRVAAALEGEAAAVEKVDAGVSRLLIFTSGVCVEL